jgi:phenylacetate-CoA ligase
VEDWSFPPRYDESYRPPPDQPYWFPHRETMDPQERDARILERLREVCAYAYEHAPFYRAKWGDFDARTDLKTLEDFERLPVITKDELRADQAEHPPFGSYTCIDAADVVRVHGTSGTTGRPTAFGIGSDDWRAIANAHARIMWGMGIRATDTVFIGSVFSLYMGSWATLSGAERLGAAAFPFGAGVAGQSQRAVNWMAQMKPAAFYGTPSYALRLAEIAAEEGIDPKDFGVRILFFSGEPGASIPTIRDRIETLYGGKVFDCGSMAEMTPWMNLGESSAQAGMLCWQDVVYTEVCDPETHRRLPFGGEGTPVYTHLERTSQPMIRLQSGDLTRWESGPSPCGRTYPILPKGIYGRIDDMFTIRGENVYPAAIDEVLSGMEDYGGEHRILISRQETMDKLAVRVEHRVGADVEAFAARAGEALRTTLGVSTAVVPVPPGTFERTEFKARRVIDERALFHEAVDA